MFLDTLMAQADAACNTCPAGTYCPQGTIEPLPCPIGYYCPSMAYAFDDVNIQRCPSGTYSGPYSLTSSTGCNTCPAGYTCLQAAFSGVVMSTMTQATEMISSMPVPCNPGYYNPNTGGTTCTQCPAGRPCPYYGMTTYEIGIFCAPGYYCPAGTKFPN